MKTPPQPPRSDPHCPSLQRYISQSGYCSRRKAAQLIAEGRAKLDGAVCSKPWQAVLPHQRVQIDGSFLNRPKRLLYLALHKPPGYLSSNSDPQGRACANHLIQPVYRERLFHVGRLDKNSSGLIFFTNDGDFAQAVQHPSQAIEKEYTIKTRKSIPEFVLQHWQRGIEIEGIRYRLQRYELLGQRELRLVLIEGLNREIRRVFEHFHIPLKRVHRLRIGSVRLRGLRPGEFRPLQAHEIRSFQNMASGKKQINICLSQGPHPSQGPRPFLPSQKRRHRKAHRIGLYNHRQTNRQEDRNDHRSRQKGRQPETGAGTKQNPEQKFQQKFTKFHKNQSPAPKPHAKRKNRQSVQGKGIPKSSSIPQIKKGVFYEAKSNYRR